MDIRREARQLFTKNLNRIISKDGELNSKDYRHSIPMQFHQSYANYILGGVLGLMNKLKF